MPDHTDTESAGSPSPVSVVASPLSLLFDEERHGDRQAREVVFCTFNADLGFFERTILGVTQATGARTTVVADARMANPDPRAARNAGLRYVHGVAVTDQGTAFHPKMLVVVGPERGMLAIGSGNLSVGGWHLNAETWTVAIADRTRSPALLTQVAEWLRAVDRVCAITPQAVYGMQRTAKALDDLTDGAAVIETGHHLVHNLRRPITDQLPADPVDELLLYAPFHDENGAAVGALVRQLAPHRVTLAVQSGSRTVIQPRALAAVFAELAVPLTVIEDATKPYRHGKLVEAVTAAGNRWTLTGSPNLSAAALLKSAADGGNVELGVLTHASDSLFPNGITITLTDVPAVSIKSSATTRPASPAVLIEAARADDGLHLTFARPTRQPVRILASGGTDYNTWKDIGAVPAGAQTHVFADLDMTGGTRVRLCWQADGGIHEGPLLFVTDRDRVLARAGVEHNRRGASQGPAELLGDPRLVERWLDNVHQLATASRAVALPRAGGTRAAGESPSDQGSQRSDSDVEGWLTYSDSAKARLGSRMFRFALGGLPAVASSLDDTEPTLLAPTDRLVDERIAGLQDDDPNRVNEYGDPTASEHAGGAEAALHGHTEVSDGGPHNSRPELSEQDRRRIRRRLGRAAHREAPDTAAIDRLAIGGLILIAIEWQIWDRFDGEDGWVEVLAALLSVLDDGAVPTDLEANVASFAAVAIYLIRDHVPASGRTREAVRFEAAAAATAHLYPAAVVELVANHAAGVHNSRGFPVDPDEVMRVVAMVVQDDPLADAIEALGMRHSDWKVHRHSGQVLHIHGSFRTPFYAAAEALETADQVDVLAVWATSVHGSWALAVRSGKDLFHVERTRGHTIWRHFRLNSLATATRISRDSELASRLRVQHGPLTRPIPEAVAVFLSAGLNVLDAAPACF